MRSPGGHRIKLALESLESRYCPSGPQITSFSASVLQGKTVLLSGTVSDPGASSVSVNFQGVASGTATVVNGSFSLDTQATALGTIYAQAFDNLNLFSGQMPTQLHVPPPTLSLSLAENGGRSVTLSGSVSAGTSSGLTVGFSGEVTGSATTDSNGNYSFTANASAAGPISAQVTDIWGQLSNSAMVMICNPAPTITFTVAQAGGHNVTINGQVNDQSPGGLTVTFSGVVSGTATTSSTGSFTYSGTATALGQVNASVTDVWGAMGNGSAQLTDTVPSISNLNAVYSIANGFWTISGNVVGQSVAGLTVTFSNVPGVGTATATVEGDGFFTLEVDASQDATNTVYATVTDWWGVVSQTASTTM